MTAHDTYKFDAAGADEPDSLAPSTNLLPPILGLIGIGIGTLLYAMILAAPHGAADGELAQCAAIDDGHARLACYDEFARPHQPIKGALAPFGPHERLP